MGYYKKDYLLANINEEAKKREEEAKAKITQWKATEPVRQVVTVQKPALALAFLMGKRRQQLRVEQRFAKSGVFMLYRYKNGRNYSLGLVSHAQILCPLTNR